MKLVLIIASASAILGCISAAPSPTSAGPQKLTNFKLVECTVKDASHLSVLRALELKSKINLWSDVPSEEGTMLLSVSPSEFAAVKTALKHAQIQTEVVEEDLQKLVDEERAGVVSTYSTHRALRDDIYESYDQIIASIEYYQTQPSVGTIRKFIVGKTYLGKNIVGIQINNDATNPNKKLIVMECGIHAREWISTSTCNYLIHQLITKQDHYKSLLDRYEFRIIPSTNPDGYEYSMNKERLWRKNREPFGRCSGVDLNRNFKAGPHCGVGTENDTCSEVYCGPAPFSSAETNSLNKYMTGIKDRVDYYVSLHAFGLMWMYPYSYTYQQSADHKELDARAKIGAQAITKLTKTNYRVGPIASTIYAVTGSSIDWAYDSLGIKKSYILELQPSQSGSNIIGGRGFILPATRIRSVGNETFTGLQAMWLSQ